MKRFLSIATAAALIALAGAPGPAHCHTVLDPEIAQAMLAEIAGYEKSARTESSRQARAEALFKLGVRVGDLVDLLDQDLVSHGGENPLAGLLIKRLAEYGVRVAYSEPPGRFGYDQAAFREYLKLEPNGPHAAEARYRILAEGFRATVKSGPGAVAAADRNAVVRAAAEEENFLRDYPNHPRTKEVRFFLGVDCFRLSRSAVEPAKARQYEHCARDALEHVIQEYPGSIEARAASTLAEELSRGGQKP
ncbi:MAG TPA: outer membrane protein assembly factor BamD [Burkholderiales bacterium]|nr:outer membrane protein assembly factor BamD [Burkholderiales bacterium]